MESGLLLIQASAQQFPRDQPGVRRLPRPISTYPRPITTYARWNVTFSQVGIPNS